jgi:hypothetical protein
LNLIDLPVAVGGSAFGCTGDLESTFFVESLGELPMIEVGSRVCGGGVTGCCEVNSFVAYTG